MPLNVASATPAIVPASGADTQKNASAKTAKSSSFLAILQSAWSGQFPSFPIEKGSPRASIPRSSSQAEKHSKKSGETNCNGLGLVALLASPPSKIPLAVSACGVKNPAPTAQEDDEAGGEIAGVSTKPESSSDSVSPSFADEVASVGIASLLSVQPGTVFPAIAANATAAEPSESGKRAAPNPGESPAIVEQARKAELPLTGALTEPSVTKIPVDAAPERLPIQGKSGGSLTQWVANFRAPATTVATTPRSTVEHHTDTVPRPTVSQNSVSKNLTLTPDAHPVETSSHSSDRGKEPDQKKDTTMAEANVASIHNDGEASLRPRPISMTEPATEQVGAAVRDTQQPQSSFISSPVTNSAVAESGKHSQAGTGFARTPEHVPANEPLPAPEVNVARFLARSDHSEMHLDVRTSVFGDVQLHTVIRDTQVGVTVGSEKGDLSTYLNAELPGMQKNLQAQSLRFDGIQFLGNGIGGGNPGESNSRSQNFPHSSPANLTSPKEPGNDVEPVQTAMRSDNELNIRV